MNWGGAPAGTGAGSRRSGTRGPTGAGGCGTGTGAGTISGAGGTGDGAVVGAAPRRGERPTRGRARWRRLRTRRSRAAASDRRASWRGARDACAGFVGLAADSDLPPRRSSWRSVLSSGSPRLTNTALGSATAAHAKASSATARAEASLGIAGSRRRRLCACAQPKAADAARGAAKIEPLGSVTPSGAAGTGAATSNTLRRAPPELSEVKPIYVREARNPKNGPPAAEPASTWTPGEVEGARQAPAACTHRHAAAPTALCVSDAPTRGRVVRDAQDPSRQPGRAVETRTAVR